MIEIITYNISINILCQLVGFGESAELLADEMLAIIDHFSSLLLMKLVTVTRFTPIIRPIAL